MISSYCAEVLHIKKKMKSGMKVKVKYKIKYLPKRKIQF